MELLLNFVDTIKNGESFSIPTYSLMKFTISFQILIKTIEAPDFLIVEGINVFQKSSKYQRLYVRTILMFLIYVDADVDNIETWYFERFQNC